MRLLLDYLYGCRETGLSKRLLSAGATFILCSVPWMWSHMLTIVYLEGFNRKFTLVLSNSAPILLENEPSSTSSTLIYLVLTLKLSNSLLFICCIHIHANSLLSGKISIIYLSETCNTFGTLQNNSWGPITSNRSSKSLLMLPHHDSTTNNYRRSTAYTIAPDSKMRDATSGNWACHAIIHKIVSQIVSHLFEEVIAD